MPSSGTREREVPLWIPQGSVSLLNTKTGSSSPVATTPKSSGPAGTQKTVSESHHFDRKHGHYDGGGPFYTALEQYSGNYPNVRLEVPSGVGGSNFVYSGPLIIGFPSTKEYTEHLGGAFSKFRSEDTSDLDPDGATAISLCSPVNPVSGLATGVSESYREGLPSLPGISSWRHRTDVARSAAGEYLNAEFGWLPLVSEINDVVNAARFHRDILNQYHRDEGRNVRREFSFPVSRSSQEWTQSSLQPDLKDNGSEGRFRSASVLGRWRRTVIRQRITRRWFSGAFTYGTPSSTDSWRRALGFGSDADKLFGIALSPDIVWELTPWSWAADWFSNAGDVINNITNFELAGQIMRYGYMMEESIDRVTTTYTLEKLPTANIPGNTAALKNSVPSTEREVITKVRRPANPFGFGLTSADLSPTQLLIAAAVGITLL